MSLVPELCKPNLLYVNSTCTIDVQMCEYKIINLKMHLALTTIKAKIKSWYLNFVVLSCQTFEMCKYGGLSTAAIN